MHVSHVRMGDLRELNESAAIDKTGVRLFAGTWFTDPQADQQQSCAL